MTRVLILGMTVGLLASWAVGCGDNAEEDKTVRYDKGAARALCEKEDECQCESLGSGCTSKLKNKTRCANIPDDPSEADGGAQSQDDPCEIELIHYTNCAAPLVHISCSEWQVLESGGSECKAELKALTACRA